MLYCPNYSCQTANPETYRFCQKCRTPLTRNYLWAIGAEAAGVVPETLLSGRYLCKAPHIFLDTRPGLPPLTSSDSLPSDADPYLKLSPYQLHIPQIYDLITPETASISGTILLLEQKAIYTPPVPHSPQLSAEVGLLPQLAIAWKQASVMQQLHWLWQIAQLWQPLSLEQVATTLLVPELLRVEGSLVRVLELVPDSPSELPSLSELGQQWSTWVSIAQPEIQPFLESVCQQILQGSLSNIETVVGALDQQLRVIAPARIQQLQITTRTDQGPSRQRNEDACYPSAGTLLTRTSSDAPTYVLVCDGIGGHQGGDVASGLAIAAATQQLQALPLVNLAPDEMMTALDGAVRVANDQIAQRNDSEMRQERQRMGTTIVLALTRAHELYLAHVGDSRAYRITRWGCHQVTMDDDVASREVRLGYSFYRDALQHPSAGSLVQALGMAASSLLYPTVQRFLLDEDCIFLICSDGLSDNDRVEQVWESELLPLLEGTVDLAEVSDRLVQIANTRNGHDNVTVALIHCRVTPQPPDPLLDLSGTIPVDTAISSPAAMTTEAPTQVIAPVPSETSAVDNRRSPKLWPLLLSLLLLSLAGLMFFAPLRQRLVALLDNAPTPAPAPVTPASPVVSPSPIPLNVFLQIGSTNSQTGTSPGVMLLSAPGEAALEAPPLSPGSSILIPTGSTVKTLEEQMVGSDRWLKLRLCKSGTATVEPSDVSPATSTAVPAAPTADPAVSPPAPIGDVVGWVAEKELAPIVRLEPFLSGEQRGVCPESRSPITAPTPTPTAIPTPLG